MTVISAETLSFPKLSADLIARDASGNALDDLSTLIILEDGVPVEDFSAEPIPVGIDLIFVIDANRNIRAADTEGDVSRLSKARTAIANYGRLWMNGNALDRASVIVPDGADEAQFIIEDTASGVDLVDAIGAYDPPELEWKGPTEALLMLAFEHAAEIAQPNRYQAIVYFSDAGDMDTLLDYDALLAAAELSDVRFFGAILGRVASDRERANMAGLANPTGGYSVHLFDIGNADFLFSTIEGNAFQQRVAFRSGMKAGGEHELILKMGSAEATHTLDLEVLPADITLILPPNPITRKHSDLSANIADFQPNILSISANISWPDGHPRGVDSVNLLVNGALQILSSAPVLDANGSMTFDWDIRNLGAGNYDVVLQLVDELGIEAVSNPHAQTIALESEVIALPTVPPAPTAEPTATTTPLEIAKEVVTPYANSKTIQLGLLGLAALLLLIVVWKLTRRRRRRNRQIRPADEVPPVIMEPSETLKARPDRVYLVPFEFWPDNEPFLIGGDSVTIGSDPMRVDVVIDHESISRLHARLIYEDHNFVLYDEGSAYGTTLNYLRVGLSPQVLKEGDEIRLGKVGLRFEFGDAPPADGSQEEEAPDDPSDAVE